MKILISFRHLFIDFVGIIAKPWIFLLIPSLHRPNLGSLLLGYQDTDIKKFAIKTPDRRRLTTTRAKITHTERQCVFNTFCKVLAPRVARRRRQVTNSKRVN